MAPSPQTATQLGLDPKPSPPPVLVEDQAHPGLLDALIVVVPDRPDLPLGTAQVGHLQVLVLHVLVLVVVVVVAAAATAAPGGGGGELGRSRRRLFPLGEGVVEGRAGEAAVGSDGRRRRRPSADGEGGGGSRQEGRKEGQQRPYSPLGGHGCCGTGGSFRPWFGVRVRGCLQRGKKIVGSADRCRCRDGVSGRESAMSWRFQQQYSRMHTK